MKQILKVEETINWLKHPDNVVSFTHTFKKDSPLAITENGRKIIKSGYAYPANDNTVIGLVYNDIDVTDGDAIGALMVHGDVIEKKLPIQISADAKGKLIDGGIYFYQDNGETLVSPTE